MYQAVFPDPTDSEPVPPAPDPDEEIIDDPIYDDEPEIIDEPDPVEELLRVGARASS